ncbi:MAG: hypothetical protein DDT35_00416 [Firmicutes bacterium]|nr:hypothetical protein [Bacillota bacterium]
MPKFISAQQDGIRRADALGHQRFVAEARRRAKIGQRIKIDGRRGKVVGVYAEFVVVEFPVFSVFWQVSYAKYRECFFWCEVKGLL